MNARTGLTVVAVFVAWQVMDFIIHGNLLMDSYAATAELWRPQEEMKMGLMAVVSLISAAAFVVIYARFVTCRSISCGLWYGVIFGIGQGASFGYGMYAVMPIPYHLALSWFLATLAQAVVAGVIVGALVKDAGKEAAA